MEFLSDFQTSVRGAFNDIDETWNQYQGLVICGTHSPQGLDIDFIFSKIKSARKTGLPFLGICFGLQLAAIEYARNVLGISDATSEEFGSGTFVIKKRKEGLNVGVRNGETFWNNYEVDLPNIWDKPKNFLVVQYHPEYQSSKKDPHPVLKEFLELCKKYTVDGLHHSAN